MSWTFFSRDNLDKVTTKKDLDFFRGCLACILNSHTELFVLFSLLRMISVYEKIVVIMPQLKHFNLD